jgi:hypothetical protein
MNMEEDLEEIKRRYNTRVDYTQFYYYVYEDEGFFDQSAVTTIDVSRFNLPEDFEEDFDNIYKLRNGEYDNDTYTWSSLYEYFSDASDISIQRMEITPSEITITFNDEEVKRDVDDFDTFCVYVERFDNKIKDMLDDEDELFQTLMDAGFIGEPPADPNFSMISQYIDSEEEWFDHFTLEGRYINRSFTLSFPTQIILYPPEASYIPTADISGILSKIINNMGKENFKPKIDKDDVAQLQFQKFFESYVDNMEGIKFLTSGKTFYNHNGYFVAERIKIGFEKMDNKNFQFVQFLDDMWKNILNAVRLYCLNEIKKIDPEVFEKLSEKHNYQQLNRIYSKYIK